MTLFIVHLAFRVSAKYFSHCFFFFCFKGCISKSGHTWLVAHFFQLNYSPYPELQLYLNLKVRELYSYAAAAEKRKKNPCFYIQY